MMTYRFDPEAAREFEEAVEFLESRREGVGQRLRDLVYTSIQHICHSPRMHREIWNGVRHAIIRDLRYKILYREENGLIRIISVFHTSRDPADWQRRV